MRKSLFAFILSFAIGLQPMALYPSKTYAQTEEKPTNTSTLYKKIVDAKSNFIRNKVFGETPGSNPGLAPSTSYIDSLDRELQAEKQTLFSSIRKNLADPTLISNRELDKAPIEWTELAAFYAVAAEMEHLKALNGTLPDPTTWKQKYEFKVHASDVIDPFFGIAAGAYMHELQKIDGDKFPFYVQFNSASADDNSYEFQLNPLLAASFAEKQMAVASSNEQMLRTAQLTAANQLYENQLLIHSLNRHEMNTIPDVPADLKEKFPLLQWKRNHYLLLSDLKDRRLLIEDLAEKKVGALAEKLRKDGLFFFDQTTMLKILALFEKTKNLTAESPELKDYLIEAQEVEQSPIFIDTLKSLLLTTQFNTSQAKEFWAQHIKLTITQAKFAAAQGYIFTIPMDQKAKVALRQVFEERKHSYLNETLQALNVAPIIKYVKSEKEYLSELRQLFQKKLWINAKRVESSLIVENDPMDLTVIADPQFIAYLNDNLNKEEIQFKAQPTKGIRADKGTIINPIQPLTAQWLQEIFKPGESYGVQKEKFKSIIFSAINDFKSAEKNTPEASPAPSATETDINVIKSWLQTSVYNPNAVKVDADQRNKIILDLQAKAPNARKNELLELIKIGENLGFFSKHKMGETPKVSQMPWTAEWMKAYHAVIKRRIFVENPLLMMKLSDAQHDGAWVSAGKSVVDFVKSKPEEKSLWQELAPLYSNEQEVTDEGADSLISVYLNAMQNIIERDLKYVSDEGAKAEVTWNPLSWRLIGRDKPYEFSEEFKKIIYRSSVLNVKLHEYSHFQNHFLKLQQSIEYDSAESKAYQRLFDYYVMYGFIGLIGLTVIGQVLKYSSPKGFALLKMFENEALAPVLGPNMSFYNGTAMVWLGADLIAEGVNTFGAERNLRDRTSDMTFSSALGGGLIDANMKDKSDGVYNAAHLKWWSQVVLLGAVGGALFVGQRYLPRLFTKTKSEFTSHEEWSKKVTNWADDVGFQKDPKTGELSVGLLKGDIEAMADASRAQVSSRMRKANENPAHTEVLVANINMSAQLLEQEASRAAQIWADIGKQYPYQFKSLRMEQGQWDIVLLNRRAKEIEVALQNKQISREQAWILKQNLSELQNAFAPYANMMVNTPGIGPAILERIASTNSRIQFSDTGQVIGYQGARMPENWWQTVKALKKNFPEGNDAFFEMRKLRAQLFNLSWVKDAKAQKFLPSHDNLYNIESKRKLIEALQTPVSGLKQ